MDFYRIILPSNELINQGRNIHLVNPNDPTDIIGGNVDSNDNIVKVFAPADADVIVLQRPTLKHVMQAIPLLRAKGIAVVIDMDDDLSHIDQGNPAWQALHPKTNVYHPVTKKLLDQSWHYVNQACAMATMVTVSTQSLVPIYGTHGRVKVLHNNIPGKFLDVPHEDSPVIGWGGSVQSHPNDLQVMGPAIAQIARDGYPFKIVGPGEGVARILGLDTEPEFTGAVDINDWPIELSKLGIGLAPLVNSKFNRSKSCLKPLEMSALGVPWVASPSQEYLKLHKMGAGVLAARPKDWLRRLRELVRSPAMREDFSGAGRDVARKLTVEGNAWRWWDAWTEAYRIERQGSSALFR